MVSGEHRFHGLSSLRFVHGRGAVVRGKYFAVKHAYNPKRKTYRVAVVVSKKVSKSAVVRNRIRRRLYEAVRGLEQGVTQPYDIAIMVYSEDLATIKSEALHQQLQKQLKTAKII